MELITCLNCSTDNPSKAKFCKTCGKRLKCESCGEPLEKDARNCINCGEPIENKLNSSNRNTIDYSNNNGNVNLKIDVTDGTAQSSITEIFKNIGLSGNNTRQIGPKDNEGSYSKPETHDVHHEEITSPQDNIKSNSTPGVNTEEYPHLNDVEMNIKCSEANWIAIYAFYISNYGTEYFSQSQVKERYLTERKGDSNKSNFSQNWKSLFSKYFRTKSDDNYYFIKESIPELANIITGKTKATQSNYQKKPKTKPEVLTKTTTKKAKPNRLEAEEIDILGGKGKITLEDFFAKHNIGLSSSERVLAIAYYVARILQQDKFSDGNVEYIYRALNLPRKPAHLRQVITNLKNDKQWVRDVEDNGKSYWQLTSLGEKYFDKIHNINN